MGHIKCEICSCEEFETGPSCGIATNVKCARCGARYNNTPFGLEFLGTETKPKVKVTRTGEVLSFESTSDAMEYVKNQPDFSPFGHNYLVYNEDNVLVLDG